MQPAIIVGSCSIVGAGGVSQRFVRFEMVRSNSLYLVQTKPCVSAKT